MNDVLDRKLTSTTPVEAPSTPKHELAEQLFAKISAKHPNHRVMVKLSTSYPGKENDVTIEADPRDDHSAPSKIMTNLFFGTASFAAVAAGLTLIIKATRK